MLSQPHECYAPYATRLVGMQQPWVRNWSGWNAGSSVAWEETTTSAIPSPATSTAYVLHSAPFWNGAVGSSASILTKTGDNY